MRPDPLEEHLTRVPLRSPPDSLRTEILSAMETAAGSRSARKAIRHSPFAIRRFMSSLVRGRAMPSPWSVLAASWCLAVVLHLGGLFPLSVSSDPRIAGSPRASQDFFAFARAYHAEVAQLLRTDEGGSASDGQPRIAVPINRSRPRTSLDRQRGDYPTWWG
jgi:hypothetical protein